MNITPALLKAERLSAQLELISDLKNLFRADGNALQKLKVQQRNIINKLAELRKENQGAEKKI